MDWSAKQGYILTGGGKIEEHYNAPLFPWTKDELPHYHKMQGDTWEAFQGWKREGRSSPLVEGAWSRPLFVGGFQHTDSATEAVFNLQSASLFIDLRIPRGPNFRGRSGFDDLTDNELKLFARRHCFAGYSLLNHAPFSVENPPVCVRHHCLDWNFSGKMRPRPNKWRIEMDESREVWKEFGYAKDLYGQHVYMERWEQLPGGTGPSLALAHVVDGTRVDGILIVQGDHFNFARDRATPQPADPRIADAPGLQAAVDTLVDAGERALAIEHLSFQGCHGRTRAVGSLPPWTVDCALQPWTEGKPLVAPGALSLSPDGQRVLWGGEIWEVVENSFTPSGLQALFSGRGAPGLSKL
mmetsp:Transcript_62558/g.148973  ORF Transcript_62558/g.148973 Transcript_62558/m.148973 type:complete len:354 (+) Transcript_62558:148-1209(+)